MDFVCKSLLAWCKLTVNREKLSIWTLLLEHTTLWWYLQWPSGVSSLFSVSALVVYNHYLKILSFLIFFSMMKEGRLHGGVGATGKGTEIMSGIFDEGGYWRVRGWTKTASAERMYHATVRFKNYACEMSAFFVTNCPRRQDCLIWGWNKDLLHILLVH